MNRASVVWPEMAKFADLSAVTNAQASALPNPAVDGFRSFMTPDGTSVRNTWPLPRDAIKQIHSETNCEGCSKATVQQHSHSQRTGLWITLCMVHETIIEYHLIKNGEGRRDCLIPLFRFKKEPPEAVFCDTACFCEESGLKWLPGFFRHTKWFHDLFHGYAHVSLGFHFQHNRSLFLGQHKLDGTVQPFLSKHKRPTGVKYHKSEFNFQLSKFCHVWAHSKPH